MCNYHEEGKLTERENDCLWWASKGKSMKEIARILSVSPSTVDTHNKNIRRKLRCNTMIEAVVKGIARGYIKNDQENKK